MRDRLGQGAGVLIQGPEPGGHSLDVGDDPGQLDGDLSNNRLILYRMYTCTVMLTWESPVRVMSGTNSSSVWV